MGLIGEKLGKYAESCTKEELTELMMKPLRLMYGKSALEPTRVCVSSWAEDPYCRGSYSAIPVSGANVCKTLAKPVENCVFFAGEHTSQNHFSYLRGAYDSGLREAKRILSVGCK